MADEAGGSVKPSSVAGRDTNIAQSISGGVAFGPVLQGRDFVSIIDTTPRLGTNNLPRDIDNFTGRHEELELLASVLTESNPRPVVISGMAGCGKTALAIHFAHRAADHGLYPDGLIYARLGSNEGGDLPPEEILEALLIGLGVPPGHMPTGIEPKSALYRSILYQRRVLIVLDEATETRQVLPLIPSSPSAVIITSRHRLLLLDEAVQIDLAVLSAEQSVELLYRLVGPQITSDDLALRQIAELCGYLPLAIRIAGATLRARPGYSATQLVAELTDLRKRLNRLDIGDRSVRGVFEFSYRRLDDSHARAFRLLSFFPGRAFDASAAAAMLGSTSPITARLLDELVYSSLITEVSVNRYRYHDLLREYAQELSIPDFPDDKSAVLARLRKWYLDQIRSTVAELMDGHMEEGSAIHALEWLEEERTNVLGLAAETVATEYGSYVWELADALYPFYDLRGYWADCQDIYELALRVARVTESEPAVERILNNLGVAYRERHLYTESISCLEESLALSRSSESKESSAIALMNLGVAYRGSGRSDQAVSCLESALSLSYEVGLGTVTWQVLSNLGNVYQDLSRSDDAQRAYMESLALCRSVGDSRGEAILLASLGALYQQQCQLREAWSCVSQSLTIARNIFDRVNEGRALRTLGSISAAEGATDKAIPVLENSVRIAEQVGDAETSYLASRQLGDLYFECGRLGEAGTWYQSSRLAAQEIGDLHREANVITALALVARHNNDPELSLTYCNQAVELLRDSSEWRDLVSALNSTGSTLMGLSRPSDATVCFEEAAAVSRDIGDRPLELESLTQLTKALEDLGADDDVSAAQRRIAEIRDHLTVSM
jgi:tetratricopeptide (TPR) repeat protein